MKYNRERGWVKISTGLDDGRPTLQVVNSGQPIESGMVAELVQPFRRLNGSNGAVAEDEQPRGLGLGLSIVAAIADAHGASLGVRARPEGGLDVRVGFPPRPARQVT